MKTKIIKTVEVKELGAINMESIEASEGQLTVHIHLDKASGELENLLCKMQQDFMKKHPEVEEIRMCAKRCGKMKKIELPEIMVGFRRKRDGNR